MNSESRSPQNRITLTEAFDLYLKGLGLKSLLGEKAKSYLRVQHEGNIYLSDYPVYVYASGSDYYIDGVEFNAILERVGMGAQNLLAEEPSPNQRLGAVVG